MEYKLDIVESKISLLKANFTRVTFIFFNEVKYSPYHPKGIIKKYKKKSAFRKPGNLMIRDIFKNWLIDKKNSFMIGDKNSDRICAEKSKLNFQFARKNFSSQIKTLTR